MTTGWAPESVEVLSLTGFASLPHETDRALGFLKTFPIAGFASPWNESGIS